MQTYRTVVEPLKEKGLINHGEPLLLIGSCFTDNIGRSLLNDLFDVDVNPFGPLYNPVSILRSLETLENQEIINPDNLFELNGQFNSFKFHSRFSGSDRNTTAENMTSRVRSAHETLINAKVVIITLGTTRVFIHKGSGNVVANCHKVSGKEFESHHLSLCECSKTLSQCVELIKRCNPNAKIIFTVSPLRYTEQGAHGNQLAKSALLLAIDEVSRLHGDNTVGYFPAYEIMMDDLRDYRFYADDMKHPSSLAIDYIYEIFRASYFSPQTEIIATEARSLTRRLAHRITSSSAETVTYETNVRNDVAEALVKRYPKLSNACQRYINTLFQQNNGLQHI